MDDFILILFHVFLVESTAEFIQVFPQYYATTQVQISFLPLKSSLLNRRILTYFDVNLCVPVCRKRKNRVDVSVQKCGRSLLAL